MKEKILAGLGSVALALLIAYGSFTLGSSLNKQQSFGSTSYDQWNVAALNVFGATVLKTLSITGATSLATTTVTGHFITTGSVPTLVAGGSGYSVVSTNAIAGSADSDGAVTTTVATANAGILTIKFATAFSAAPFCNVSNANAQAATDTYYVTSTVSAFSINFPAGLTGGVHQYNYQCNQ